MVVTIVGVDANQFIVDVLEVKHLSLHVCLVNTYHYEMVLGKIHSSFLPPFFCLAF